MFVVFEGIDGSGKTTVSNRVAQALRAQGLTVEHVREGGNFSSPLTQAIREFGRDARHLDLTPHAELFLYVMRDVQLLDERLRPALGQADVVIADRFLYSAEVIARFGRGLPDELVRPVLASAARGLVPDLVVLVDVDPHVARARRRAAKISTGDRRAPSRKGLAGVGMQHRFRAGYRELAAREPERWLTVDNDRPLEATVDLVTRVLLAGARGGTAAAMSVAQAEPKPARPAPAPLRTPGDALARFLTLVDERAGREPGVAAHLLGGLFGPEVDTRRRALAALAPEVTLAGLSGLTDEVSWALREELLPRAPAAVARSFGLTARTDPRAASLRARLTPVVPCEVLSGLAGVDTEEAWALRAQLEATAPLVVLDSLGRLGTPAAWAMRERLAVALTTYEPARALAASLTGLDDERAWELRKAARTAAPIAALQSLKGVLSDRAWKWRGRYLPRAPKAVFETLVGVDDPRAWRMREEQAALVKEALDSMDGLDGEPAWVLREGHADRWPSTVVKSLGTLAETPRGRALVERQIARHPENLSLLKHSAAIAIGAHLAVAGDDEDA